MLRKSILSCLSVLAIALLPLPELHADPWEPEHTMLIAKCMNKTIIVADGSSCVHYTVINLQSYLSGSSVTVTITFASGSPQQVILQGGDSISIDTLVTSVKVHETVTDGGPVGWGNT